MVTRGIPDYYEYFFMIAQVGDRPQILAAVSNSWENLPMVSPARRALDILDTIRGGVRSSLVKCELLASPYTEHTGSLCPKEQGDATVSTLYWA